MRCDGHITARRSVPSEEWVVSLGARRAFFSSFSTPGDDIQLLSLAHARSLGRLLCSRRSRLPRGCFSLEFCLNGDPKKHCSSRRSSLLIVLSFIRKRVSRCSVALFDGEKGNESFGFLFRIGYGCRHVAALQIRARLRERWYFHPL